MTISSLLEGLGRLQNIFLMKNILPTPKIAQMDTTTDGVKKTQNRYATKIIFQSTSPNPNLRFVVVKSIMRSF